MAKINNTRKAFNFIIEIDGVNQFEIQKFPVPEVDIEAVAHGDTNHDVFTAGRVSVGEIAVEKIKPLTSDRWAWDWLISAQNMVTGSGGTSEQYKRIIVVKEMHPNGVVALNRWLMEGASCKKCSQTTLDRMSSDNIIQTATLRVDTVQLL